MVTNIQQILWIKDALQDLKDHLNLSKLQLHAPASCQTETSYEDSVQFYT